MLRHEMLLLLLPTCALSSFSSQLTSHCHRKAFSPFPHLPNSFPCIIALPVHSGALTTAVAIKMRFISPLYCKDRIHSHFYFPLNSQIQVQCSLHMVGIPPKLVKYLNKQSSKSKMLVLSLPLSTDLRQIT